MRRGASPRPAGDPRYFGGRIPWIKISDATAEPGRWLSTTAQTVNEDGKDKSVFLKRGSLILSNSGTTGRPKFLAVDGCIHDGWLSFDEFSGIEALYLFYLLSWQTEYLSHLADGSVQKNLNTTLLKTLEVALPPLPEQRAIAHILGALDDKIELNHRMNHTLEAIARALFKSWFVDFGPVHAKAAGEQPVGMDAETAALFPDAFVDSDMELIPEGWQVRPLDKIAHFENGIAWQRFRAESGEDTLPVIKIREMRQGDFDDKSDRVRTNIKQACKVYDGDVLFSWSASLIIDIWASGDGALNQHIFKVTSKQYPKWFYYYWTKHHLDQFQQIAAGKVTTMGHIQRHHLSEAFVVIPPKPLLGRMTQIVQPLLEVIINNRLESRTLAELRDALLPRLISGELRVPAAESILRRIQ